MPSIRKPSAFTAGKKIKIFDKVYQPGEAIPIAVIRKLRNLSSLLGSRRIIPDKDPHGRKTRPTKGTPTDIPASMRKSL